MPGTLNNQRTNPIQITTRIVTDKLIRLKKTNRGHCLLLNAPYWGERLFV